MGDEREGDGVLGFIGYDLNIPGRGAQKILGGAGASPHPNPFSPKEWGYGGEPDIAGVTSDHTLISCIPDIGIDNGGGEGFVAITSDGTRYKLNRLIEMAVGSEYNSCTARSLPLKETRLVATEVVDVHGNWVKYDYTADGKLTRIYSNDGRQIDVTYHAGTSNVSTVSANGRVWTYQYSEFATGAVSSANGPISTRVLSSVTQPDGRAWQYNIWRLTSEGGGTISVTHPYGTLATYVLGQAQHYTRRWYSAGECGDFYSYRTRKDRNKAVVSKTLSGPNIPTSTWQFSYEDLGTIELNYSNEQTLTKKNSVINPDGTVAESWYYIAGKRMGRAASSRTLASLGGSVLESVSFSYEVGTELAPIAGMEFSQFVDSLKQPVLLSKKAITRGSDVFTTDLAYNSDGANANYSYGKPVLISSYSNLSSDVRTQAISYEHNKTKWILGLPDQITRNGKLFDDLGYDSFGNVLTHDQFGVRRGTYTYHAGGTAAGMMASSKDGLNRTIYYNNWKRGVAQQVTRPDGVNLLAAVDDNGWVTNQTDAKGNQTGFQYSNVGWITKIDRPAPWQDTDITYADVGGSNFHQTATRGTEETVVWYDTLHRPWNTRVRPLSGGGTTTYTRIAYDTSGREAFRSFPLASTNPADGTTLTYDGLGRALASAENVAPYATTNYAYLAGNKTQVTDPEGNVTTTTRRAYGEPGNGDIVQIAQPLGRFTDMTYDNYGNMLTATQYGSQNGFNVTNTHRYVYDSRLRLCRHSVPETGDTLYNYDNANQAVGVARGQATGTACAALPAAETIVSAYDDLGRVTSIDYPGTAPDIALTYDSNGKVIRNLRGTTDWRYTYDNADQLTEEKLLIDGRTYTTGYEYNALGARAYQTFPSGRRVDFAPNGLGQATKAEHVGGTAYASGITYHTNGSVDTISYGNGFLHNTTFNNRQLLASIHVRNGTTTAVQFSYGHDLNSRVTSITDSAVPGQNRAFTYDGLSRVLTASGPWGAGGYKYDALDNLRQKVLGGRIVNIEYDGANRVLRTQDSESGNVWHDYSHDSRGNVIGNGTLGFTYDLSNQPNALTGSSFTGTFVYDGNLKRAKQVMGGRTIYSIYSLSGALIHRDDATTDTTTDYVAAGGKTIARVKGTEVTYIHQDHLGSPVAATDAAGAIAWREDFTPYGEQLLRPFGNKNDEGFTGHIADTASGLTYMQARYYDPLTGRFLSGDPVGFDEVNPSSFNRYAYSANDPINLIDPDGQRPIAVARVLWNLSRGGGIASLRSTWRELKIDWNTLNTGTSASARQQFGAALDIILGTNTVDSAEGIAILNQNADNLEKRARGQDRQADIHRKKLNDFKQDPDAHDNKGHLAKASNDAVRRQEIINKRIQVLEKQISIFEKEAEKFREAAKRLRELTQ